MKFYNNYSNNNKKLHLEHKIKKQIIVGIA